MSVQAVGAKMSSTRVAARVRHAVKRLNQLPQELDTGSKAVKKDDALRSHCNGLPSLSGRTPANTLLLGVPTVQGEKRILRPWGGYC